MALSRTMKSVLEKWFKGHAQRSRARWNDTIRPHFSRSTGSPRYDGFVSKISIFQNSSRRDGISKTESRRDGAAGAPRSRRTLKAAPSAAHSHRKSSETAGRAAQDRSRRHAKCGTQAASRASYKSVIRLERLRTSPRVALFFQGGTHVSSRERDVVFPLKATRNAPVTRSRGPRAPRACSTIFSFFGFHTISLSRSRFSSPMWTHVFFGESHRTRTSRVSHIRGFSYISDSNTLKLFNGIPNYWDVRTPRKGRSRDGRGVTALENTKKPRVSFVRHSLHTTSPILSQFGRDCGNSREIRVNARQN